MKRNRTYRTASDSLFKPLRSLAKGDAASLAALVRPTTPNRTCQVPGLAPLLADLLPTLDVGYFVEVGAYDGEKFSNTSWLADRGWRGVYVEPSTVRARMCRMRHAFNRVRTVCCAAGAAECAAWFDDAKSLASLTATASDAGPRGRHVPVRRLDAILENAGAPEGFALMVVDVEGHEVEVFDGFDIDRWRQAVVIVETALGGAGEGLPYMLAAAGYRVAWRNPLNTVLARA